MITLNISFLVLLSAISFAHTNPKCNPKELTYAFTECDKSGHRWLVKVPKINVTCDASSYNLGAIKKGRNCRTPCKPGTFLDMETQECRDCPGGTYSQGDTIEIDHWAQMPSGFSTVSVSEPNRDCNREKFKPEGDFISANIYLCESNLYFSASLYKPGTLTFKYQKPDDDVIFQIKVSNDDCAFQNSGTTAVDSSKSDEGIVRNKHGNSKYLDATSPSGWKEVTMQLKVGHNRISWLAMVPEGSHKTVVKISQVQITNSVFSSQCTKCPSGFYSSAKSSKCTPCPKNTFSLHEGSFECKNCESEFYTYPGSSKCIKRLPCTESDYTYNYTKCDNRNKRQKHYYWIKPHICSEKLAESKKLPQDTGFEDCTPCPPGTIINSSDSGQCVYCQPHTANTGIGTESQPQNHCRKCPPHNRAVTEILYNRWSRTLPHLEYRCLHKDEKCQKVEPWILDGDKLTSERSNDINILQLSFQAQTEIILKGFETRKTEMALSMLYFEFDMHCTGECILHLFLSHQKSSPKHINVWINSTRRQIFHYPIRRTTPAHLIWFFQRNLDLDNRGSNNNDDHMNIYSIKVTRVKNVGATRCKFCGPNSSEENCLDCPRGTYYSSDQNKCVTCPKGMVLKNYPAESIEDCASCGNGLIALDGILCVPDANFVSNFGSRYDLSSLKKPILVSGSKMFTTVGHEYRHIFNFTLFVNKIDQLSMCSKNNTNFEESNVVLSPVCRITIMKDSNNGSRLYSVQAIAMADDFKEIKQSNHSISFWKSMNASLEKHGFNKDELGTNLFVQMTSMRKTDVCRHGRQLTAVLRCDTAGKMSDPITARLPPKCTSGTCDGCTFLIEFIGRQLCPLCRDEDYTIIKEECRGGKQKKHLQPMKYCIPHSKFKNTIEVKCPLYTLRTEIIIITIGSVLLLLLIIIFYCYKKNKKLEYKYMRLVTNSEQGPGVTLPGAESCAMNDGEEDGENDDDVHIKANSRSGNIFAKFKRHTLSRRRGDYEDSEKLTLEEDISAEFDL